MSKSNKNLKIFIEASPLVEPRMSGIGHITLELVRALDKHPEYGKKFEVILVAPFDKINSLSLWSFKNVKYRRILLPLRPLNLLWKFNLLPPMDLLLGRGVYIFPNYKNWWLIFSKSITYVHDISFVLFPQFVSPKNQRFLKKYMPKWLKRTTLIATDSKSAKNEILDYYDVPNTKVKVLYHGVDTKIFYPRPTQEVDLVKSKYNITGKYIFYLGNIEPRKNIERMTEAYRNLPKKISNEYSLVLVGGSGWLNQSIIESIKNAQQEGFRIIKPEAFVKDEDLPALHSGATMLLHPALYEGFGLSIVQAMACGTPVLAGNNSSMPEVVGSGGLLVDSTSVENISSTMEKILTDQKLHDELATKAIAQAQKFSWDKTTNQLVDLVIGIS